jgi:O-antigen ligase
MGPAELAYLVFATAYAVALVSQAANKPFMALVLLWLLDNPILGRAGLLPSVPGLGVELQPDRVVFLLLCAAALADFLRAAVIRNPAAPDSPARVPGSGPRQYEICLLLFTFMACAAELANLGNLDPSTVRQLIIGQCTFPLVYWAAKRNVTAHDVKLLCVALAVLAIVSSVVATIQFIVSRDFLNGGLSTVSIRTNFGGLLRSPGLFFAEYDQGVFLVMSLIFIRFINPGRHVFRRALGCSALGVIFTFHRLTWVIFAAVLAVFIIVWGRRHLAITILLTGYVFLLCTACILLLSFVIPTSFFDSIALRISQDTLSSRGDLNTFGIHMIQTYPGGVGDYTSRVYVREGLLANIPLYSPTNRTPLEVHNGFIQAAVSYGIIGMLAFIGFLGGAIMFFARRTLAGNSLSAAPLLLVLCFAAFNATNNFSQFGSHSPLFFALVLGLSAGYDHIAYRGQSLEPNTLRYAG